MTRAIRRSLAALVAAGLAGIVVSPAHANWDPTGTTTPQPHVTTPTYTTSYDSPASDSQPAVHCTVYANGTGMGSYCASLSGGGVAQTLRERFSGLAFQRCRYRPVPSTWLVRPNPDPEHGRYLVQICLDGIDWDSVTGGPHRQVDIGVAWVPYTQDVGDVDNAVNDFLWGLVSGDAQLPVPMLVTHPATPVVGEPTYFTMRWVNPATREVVAKGPYAGSAEGGPFQEVELGNGIVMTAQGTGITVDPNQVDMTPVHCGPGTPYDLNASVQPDGACSIAFSRSSASAAALQNPEDPMPSGVRDDDSYYLAITVHWNIRYGRGSATNTLGDGFDMVVHQELPVWEVQAPNQQPPQVSIH
ncbi:MAG TPA: hypothetical protein VN088_21090 [Nocardioides sp.]|nr:hypothetical protein [Nocardioides sp.]